MRRFELSWLRGLGLLPKVAAASLAAVAVMAFFSVRAVHNAVVERSVAAETEEVVRNAGSADERGLTVDALTGKIDRSGRRLLNAIFHYGLEEGPREVTLVDMNAEVAYSTNRELVETALTGSGGRLGRALRGNTATRVSGAEGARVLDVFVPVRAEDGRTVLGAFRAQLAYERIVAAAGSSARTVEAALLLGLAILWGIFQLIVAKASLRLRHTAKEAEEQALRDALTGLPNRAAFRRLVTEAVARSRKSGGKVAVMIMDLDRFKEINDTLGHFNGDLLLQRLGPRLRGTLRDHDVVARLGGDEYAVLLTDVPDAGTSFRAAERMLAALQEPFIAGGLALEVEASVGIALAPDHGERVDTLLQRADVAMYAAKRAHTGYAVYSPEQDDYSPARLALVGELRRGIQENELTLHYQPKADLQTGMVTGVEGLARWNHNRRGMIFPDEFIPLAEHTHLISPMTRHLLDIALGDCKQWHDKGMDVRVAVNLSMRSLLDLQLSDDIASLLGQWSLPPSALELEITESSVMSEPRRVMAVLTKLSEMGVVLTVDDFGTGYSSLAYLKQLPVSTIKIDRSFVLDMEEDEDDAAIVRSTIELGRNLGLRVVAEGVETKGHWTHLAALGCDEAQGYLLGRPAPFEELTASLESSQMKAFGADEALAETA